MAKKLKILIVGAGYFGTKRLIACQDLKQYFSLAGIVDINPQKAKSLGEKHHLSWSQKMQGFKDKAVDLAIIAAPNNAHVLLVKEALSYGWHVLCEKPLAINYKEAQEITMAAKKYQRLVKTGSNHRFFPSVRKAYELVKKGVIGKILTFKGSIGNDGSHTASNWFWNKNISGGGTFIDNGCHLIDIARWFMGDFINCLGYTANVYWKKTQVEDLGTGIFITKEGKPAIISSSWIQWSGYLYFEIWGDKGFIIVDSRNGDILLLNKRGKTKAIVYDFSGRPKDSYHRELLYFRECILKHKPPQPSAEDGAKVIKMIEGVYQSTKSKEWVNL